MKLLLALLLIPVLSIAHPGIGIVKDSKGNVYYTDLKDVWKIDKSGNKTIAVHNVHTHELYMDDKDELYGEHLWYNGERINTWGHYTWCLRRNGKLDTIVSPTEGFLQNYSFVRDGKGNMYWVERFMTSGFKKKTPDGIITTIAEGKFGDIRWSHCTKDGVWYFVDGDKLYKLTPDGKFTLLVSSIINEKKGVGISRRHNVFGIWTDKSDDIYIAIQSDKKVIRITPQGKIQVVAYSISPWSPTGGLFDNEGNLWLLEYSQTNEARARKISTEELQARPQKTKPVLMNHVLPYSIATGVLVLIGLGVNKMIKKKRKI